MKLFFSSYFHVWPGMVMFSVDHPQAPPESKVNSSLMTCVCSCSLLMMVVSGDLMDD